MTAPTPAKWQTLTEEADQITEKLREPGGWLYRTTAWGRTDTIVAIALTFAPDPQEQR